MTQHYVAGFLFDRWDGVALVRKNRPDWQAGKLNAIGGHLENDETPWEAMVREFEEETGYRTPHWELFATVSDGPVDWQVHFFRHTVDEPLEDLITSTTDEKIEIWDIVDATITTETLPNLSWLVPLAHYRHDHYKVIDVIERPK